MAHSSDRKLLPLRGAIQHYDWGGAGFIPALLSIENEAQKPFAELWIGAHPKAPSQVELGGGTIGLDQFIETAPEQILSDGVIRAFGPRLPYLLKVLDARKMLSIQVHPSKTEAQKGFERENAAGIPLSAGNRSYKDDNHKPEVHVALTDFWLLHGFRPQDEIEACLEALPEFRELQSQNIGGDICQLYQCIMKMPQSLVDYILNPLIHRLNPLYQAGELNKDEPDFWAARAALEFPLPDGRRDRGIFSIYLMNLVHLKPGQGTYQGAGVPHAYLEGTNMELMANSDNVLRGGLTPKHVDVSELLSVVQFEGHAPEVLTGTELSATERAYPTPAPDFQLSRIVITPEQAHASAPMHGPDSLIVMDGNVQITSGADTHTLERGSILLAPSNLAYTIRTSSAQAILYKATVLLSPERNF